MFARAVVASPVAGPPVPTWQLREPVGAGGRPRLGRQSDARTGRPLCPRERALQSVLGPGSSVSVSVAWIHGLQVPSGPNVHGRSWQGAQRLPEGPLG